MRRIRDEIFAKVKQSGKNAGLNEDILDAKLNQVQQHIHDYLSSYQSRNHINNRRAGEVVLGELDVVDDIIGYYLSQTHDVDDCKELTLIGKVEESFIQTKTSSYNFKKSENLPY